MACIARGARESPRVCWGDAEARPTQRPASSADGTGPAAPGPLGYTACCLRGQNRSPGRPLSQTGCGGRGAGGGEQEGRSRRGRRGEQEGQEGQEKGEEEEQEGRTALDRPRHTVLQFAGPSGKRRLSWASTETERATQELRPPKKMAPSVLGKLCFKSRFHRSRQPP
ncbi:unnamed protein product [Prorocentrum cordatum]|uniref:Uncharacterized protein n=1 Tax=Prorocentrum cordatum TaxID=2364126 RepID=A0ABN9RRT2_9DINO|nr:unnamed protein product [Polarella glacialis]